MPAGSTYTPIATTTLGSAQSSVSFSSFSGYTDLILVIMATDNRGGGSLSDSVGLTFNSDNSTGSTNYSFTTIGGNGSSASSSRASNYREIDLYRIGTTESGSTFSPIVAHIMNYANTTTNKIVIARGGNAAESTDCNIGLWRNTAAITSLTLWPGYNGSGYTFSTGSTFTLYGIASA